jgi:hypothetical protein
VTIVLVPKPATLKRYGLTATKWKYLLRSQGGGCGVCRQIPVNGKLLIDHEHVNGWKQMPSEQRRLHVRGLLCSWCNHYCVTKAMTVEKAEAVVKYLRRHEARRRNS